MDFLAARTDIALHFNPRYYKGHPVVVLNSRQDGTWKKDEYYGNSVLPVDSSFSLFISVSQENYQVCNTGKVTAQILTNS